eukprot:214072-Prymnesium_polylepis.2
MPALGPSAAGTISSGGFKSRRWVKAAVRVGNRPWSESPRAAVGKGRSWFVVERGAAVGKGRGVESKASAVSSRGGAKSAAVSSRGGGPRHRRRPRRGACAGCATRRPSC